MKGLSEKAGLAVLVLCAAFSGLRCNPAPDGFAAPFGSTVTITPEDTSFEDISSATYVAVTVVVTVPTGTEQTSTPGNGIFVTVSCSNTSLCTIMDRRAGEQTTLADPNHLTAVSNPYTFQTNGSGTYTVILKLETPASDSYTTSFIADIGVASKTSIFTVSLPE